MDRNGSTGSYRSGTVNGWFAPDKQFHSVIFKNDRLSQMACVFRGKDHIFNELRCQWIDIDGVQKVKLGDNEVYIIPDKDVILIADDLSGHEPIIGAARGYQIFLESMSHNVDFEAKAVNYLGRYASSTGHYQNWYIFQPE